MDAQSLNNAGFQVGNRRKAIVALLAVLPIIIVVILAMLSLQDAGLRREAAERTLVNARYQAVNDALDVELRELSLRAWQAVAEATPPEEFINKLRGMVTRRVPVLAVIYAEGDRVYPPRDSVASTPGEVLLYRRLSSQISEIAQRAYTVGESLRWLYFDGSRGLVLCRKVPESIYVACAVIGQEDTDSLLLSLAQGFEREFEGWRLQFIDATGETLQASASESSSMWTSEALDLAPTAMEGVMSGWRAQFLAAGHASDAATAVTLLNNPFWLWGVPLSVFWLLLVWHIYQRQTAELRRSHERATLAAYLSHDLRTPLANVRLYTDLIRRDAAANDRVLAHANVIEQALDRLENITSTSVALAKGAEPASGKDTFDPDDLIRKLLSLYAPKLSAAGIAVEFSAGAERISMVRSTFERVFGNLIDNACKYAPGTPVHISTQLQPKVIVLTIRDHGPGFKNLPAGEGSTGLGLRSIGSLVEDNGGDLKLEDAQPGLRVIASFKLEKVP